MPALNLLTELQSSNAVEAASNQDGFNVMDRFLSIFLSFPILHVNIKIFYVGVFSGTFKARLLKLGIHIDNELLYCGIENQTPCSYSSLYLSIFCLLRLNLCHSFLRNCAS